MNNLYIKCLSVLVFLPSLIYSQISFEYNEIANGPSQTSLVRNALGDLDGDGDLDVIVEEDKLVWYENIDGLGTYGYKKVIKDNSVVRGIDIYAVDMDSDGDQDLLFLNSSDIIWLENSDGMGIVWLEHIINSGLNLPTALHYGDLDGDGDIDIVTGISNGSNGRISWYENLDGNGNMGAEQIIASISQSSPHVRCADVDLDGDLDVIASKGTIVWYENLDANATFGTQQTIRNTSEDFYNFVVTDLDDDGDVDVLVPNGFMGPQWHKNTGGVFTTQNIAPYPSSISYCEAADFDSDGDKDLLVGYNGIQLRVNNGSESFSDLGAIGNANFVGTAKFNLGDIDNDGDLDILASTYHLINNVWLENMGGNNFTPHFIGDSPHFAVSTASSDIDQDGDMDILVGTEAGILWFENRDGNLNYPIRHVIYFDGPMEYIFLKDLDSDGDVDIVAFNENDNELVWFEHLDTPGRFGPKTLISSNGDTPTMASIADIDMDGDQDIVLASSNDNKLAWYSNLDGQGTFGTEQVITTSATNVYETKVADMDGDGDMDVIASVHSRP